MQYILPGMIVKVVTHKSGIFQSFAEFGMNGFDEEYARGGHFRKD
jgi:hypothetical protein